MSTNSDKCPKRKAGYGRIFRVISDEYTSYGPSKGDLVEDREPQSLSPFVGVVTGAHSGKLESFCISRRSMQLVVSLVDQESGQRFNQKQIQKKYNTKKWDYYYDSWL